MGLIKKYSAAILFALAITYGYGQCSPDLTPPEITCPADITVDCPIDIGNIFAFQTSIAAVVSDNCGNIDSVTYVLSGATNAVSPGSGINDATNEIFLAGTTTVTYTATDASNNSTSCSFIVTVNDNIPPNIISCPEDLTLTNSPGLCLAQVTQTELGFPTAYDNCFGLTTVASGITLIDQPDPQPDYYEFPIGTTTVNWTVTDRAGNSSSCTQYVTVSDTEAPVMSCPSDITINTLVGDCDAYVTIPLLSVSDNCSISSITNDFTSGGDDASGIYPIGLTLVTFTATDSSNNSASCSINVTVVSNEPPVITLNGSDTITLEVCSNYTELGATAFDTCLGDISSNIAIDSSGLNMNAVGSYSIVYSVSNATPVVRTINVVDTTPPTLSLIGPSMLTIGDCSTYTELGALAIDSCLGDISGNVVIDNSSVDTSTLGSYTVTYSVTDNNGNAADSITRTVIVTDSNPPIITLLGDNPQILEACETYTELGATAIDPCFGSDFSSNLVIDTSNLDTSVPGNYIVTYNATDDNGNPSFEVIRDIQVVDTTPPELTLLGDNPQIVSACTPYVESGATAIDVCSGIDYTSNIIIDTSGINTSVEGTYTVNYSVCDSNGNCSSTITRDIEVILTNSVADAGSDFTNSVCTDTTISLNANPVIGSQSSGLWSVTSGQTSGFSFSDSTSPTSSFTGDVGETYTLTWTIDNPDPCVDVSDSITVTFITCSTLDFDGVDDNVTFRNSFNFSSNFSIELWVKSESQNNNIQTIFSKREANVSSINGYDIRVVNNYISFNWNNGNSLVAPYQINTNQWHHVAVTFNGGLYKLFIDGIEMASASGSVPASNSNACLAGAMDQTINPPFKPVNYFDGGMDELRIWSIALSEKQIRQMMNQEIENNSGSIRGSAIPIDITGLTWSNLTGYYQMNQSTDISGGDLLPSNTSSVSGRLRYMTTNQAETAPLPYRSTTNGNWSNSSTWLYGNVQAIPNSIGIDGSTKIDWNIVKTLHDISSGNNDITLLGLDVSANTLTIENANANDGQSLRVTDYLKIDGTLKLVGESQLLQDMESVVDYTGTGELHRDQQGTTNLYNYNYWSSPVSTDGSNFSVGSILHDGLQPVLWTQAHNANPSTTPITLSRRWLYIYENFPDNSYADWNYINENYAINVGLGYLMKGSGAYTAEQNYTFIGKPNNGSILSPITANYQALVGNPYPSAIDAYEFIYDNSSSIQGALYFWEHYASNATHVLEDYEGGYAVYNLSGGVAAVSPPEISGNGTPSKIPERYVAVGQGFFVQANTTGGNVLFENDQRVFVKEQITGAADNGSVFFRNNNQDQASNIGDEAIQRLRLNFITPEGAVRPLLLAFVPNGLATDGYDYGYDALNTESLPNDMSWVIEGQNYIIQGVGDFDETKSYPLNIHLETPGAIQIELIELENFEETIDVFVYDSLLETYTRINEFNYQETLEMGDYNSRFYITFTDNNTLSTLENQLQQVIVKYLMSPDEIYIKTPVGMTTQKVELINLLGQSMYTWDVSSPASEIRLPLKRFSESHYIVKVQTSVGTINKKITVKF